MFGSLVCGAWHRVLLPDRGSSRSYSLNSEIYLLLLDVGLRVETEAMEKDKGRHNETIANDHPKHFDVVWVFGFYYYRYILSGWCKLMFVR